MRQIGRHKEVKAQHRRGKKKQQNGALAPFILFLDIFSPALSTSRAPSFSRWWWYSSCSKKKFHTSRLDNKTGASTEGGCSRCAGFRPWNERTEGADCANHPWARMPEEPLDYQLLLAHSSVDFYTVAESKFWENKFLFLCTITTATECKTSQPLALLLDASLVWNFNGNNVNTHLIDALHQQGNSSLMSFEVRDRTTSHLITTH